MDNNFNNDQQTQPNYSQQTSNTQQPNYSQQASNTQQPNYSQQASNTQQQYYNQQASNTQQQYYNQQASYVQQPQYNQQTSNVQQPQYNQQTSNVQQPQYNQQTSNVQQQYYNQQASYVQQPQYNQQVSYAPQKTKMQLKINVYCLVGIIGAVLLILAPFINFASIHFNSELTEESGYVEKDMKIKVNDGLNMFELSKASGTFKRMMKEADVKKKDILDNLDILDEELADMLEYETDMDINKSTINEAMGALHLVVDGRIALLLTPYLIIISGMILLMSVVTNKKTYRFVGIGLPILSLIWLMFCSSHFLSMMGLGVWAIIVGVILGTVSIINDKKQ